MIDFLRMDVASWHVADTFQAWFQILGKLLVSTCIDALTKGYAF